MNEFRNYLVLVKLAKKDKATGDGIMLSLNKVSKQEAKMLWFDDAYIGFAINTFSSAHEIRNDIVDALKEESRLSDILIVELGNDWYARRDTIADGWLNSHLGRSLGASLSRHRAK